MCRAGFPGHLGAPWNQYDAVEIDFVLQMKIWAAFVLALIAVACSKPGEDKARELAPSPADAPLLGAEATTSVGSPTWGCLVPTPARAASI
jgi:hypothetical protein